jgi:hypothetical protein
LHFFNYLLLDFWLFLLMIMTKLNCFLSVLLFFVCVRVHAQVLQPVPNSAPLDKITLGVGAGYDFGGYGGVNAIYYPQRSIGVFAAGGYTPAGIGYNFGIKLRAISNKSASEVMPFFVAMRGYYTAVAPKDFSYYNRLFFGTTLGAGVDFRPDNSKFGYITGTILVPIRNVDSKNYIDYLNTFAGVPITHKLHAINGSIGYKFILFR